MGIQVIVVHNGVLNSDLLKASIGFKIPQCYGPEGSSNWKASVSPNDYWIILSKGWCIITRGYVQVQELWRPQTGWQQQDYKRHAEAPPSYNIKIVIIMLFILTQASFFSS